MAIIGSSEWVLIIVGSLLQGGIVLGLGIAILVAIFRAVRALERIAVAFERSSAPPEPRG